MLDTLRRKVLNLGAFWISYLKLVPILRQNYHDTIILDCVANDGKVAQLFARTGAEVYAFEPDPVAYRLLQKRLGDQKKVHCLQKAVWTEHATLDLYLYPRHDHGRADFTVSSSLVKEKCNVSDQYKVEVQAVDLIAFIKNLDKKVAILKMDVEGAEIKILERLIAEEVYKWVGLILVETHETKIHQQQAPLRAIKASIARQNITNIKLNWI